MYEYVLVIHVLLDGGFDAYKLKISDLPVTAQQHLLISLSASFNSTPRDCLKFWRADPFGAYLHHLKEFDLVCTANSEEACDPLIDGPCLVVTYSDAC